MKELEAELARTPPIPGPTGEHFKMRDDDATLNLYGDNPIPTTGRHGFDIAVQRFDDLDRAAVKFLLEIKHDQPSAVDIACGRGTQGIRFALLGAKTTLVELMDISKYVEPLTRYHNLGSKLKFLHKDARDLTSKDLPPAADLIFSQRFLHFLRYSEAKKLLSTVKDSLRSNGRIFLSASGMESELSNGYPGNGNPIEERFFDLSKEVAEHHDIEVPVCLYKEHELQGLLEDMGFEIIDAWTSDFGNVKAIGSKR